MDLITDEIATKIKNNVINAVYNDDYNTALYNIPLIIDEFYTNIPDEKRNSYGIVHTIKVLGNYLYDNFTELEPPVYQIAARLFESSDNFKTKGVALNMLSYYGLDDFYRVLPFFENAAISSHWQVREFSQMFFRKLIKKYPAAAHDFLIQLSLSDDANKRRFVAETLRPVQENKWFYQNPEFPLAILRNLFQEKAAYPRTAVGNNLSDLARRLPDLVFDLVKQLVASEDKNSYWIAYRACRNLVKKEPLKVMDLLEVDVYKYKKRVYKRSDY